VQIRLLMANRPLPGPVSRLRGLFEGYAIDDIVRAIDAGRRCLTRGASA